MSQGKNPRPSEHAAPPQPKGLGGGGEKRRGDGGYGSAKGTTRFMNACGRRLCFTACKTAAFQNCRSDTGML